MQRQKKHVLDLDFLKTVSVLETWQRHGNPAWGSLDSSLRTMGLNEP